MSYFFAPASRAEHLEQIAYYEAQRKGLGARYLAAFKQEMVQICAFPGRYKVVRPPDIRGHGIQGFPLDILYRVKGDSIEILAESHHRRRPDYWLGRI